MVPEIAIETCSKGNKKHVIDIIYNNRLILKNYLLQKLEPSVVRRNIKMKNHTVDFLMSSILRKKLHNIIRGLKDSYFIERARKEIISSSLTII